MPFTRIIIETRSLKHETSINNGNRSLDESSFESGRVPSQGEQ